ncbi:hypothetical protein HK096_000238 [Nowakowskiella sp. JEL0078]|nr:hypothetical protein HK096_000238 [Nowakowskiella sp. JEL0078]
MCFYVSASKHNEKIGFYFAVQSGDEDFDMHFQVAGPDFTEIISASQQQADMVIAAKQPGEHSFCFTNPTSSDKTIDFDLALEKESETYDEIPTFKGSDDKEKALELVKALHENVDMMKETLLGLGRNQAHFHTRTNRNFATVLSTERRIFWFSVSESFLIMCVALAQVFFVQMLFNKGQKTRV